MKKIDFDVFALISPLQKPVTLTPDKAPALKVPTPPPSYALLLANSIRANRFVLPQVEMLGKQMTQGPSPVRILHFGPFEVPDFALQKVIRELDEADIRAIRSYLWNIGEIVRDPETMKWVELDPPFAFETERAFKRVFKILEQLGVLVRAPRRRRRDNDERTAL